MDGSGCEFLLINISKHKHTKTYKINGLVTIGVDIVQVQIARSVSSDGRVRHLYSDTMHNQTLIQ